eukprot:NODE_14_length_42432_cov_0.433799.p11 type:complete len:363 gc:universal NODE_14_length_42432_cov_0.433799:41769-40681(-)
MNIGDDSIALLTQYLDINDLHSISLTCNKLRKSITNILSNVLCISNSNLEYVLNNYHKFENDRIHTLTVTGDFSKQQRSDLQTIWGALTPRKLILDSSVADFPTFYKCSLFFSKLKCLEAHNGSLEFIDLDKFVNVDTLVIVSHDNHDVHLRVKDNPKIKKLIFKDCIFVPHSQLSDYIFGGGEAPDPEDVAVNRIMPHLTHLISHNAIVQQETLRLNVALANNAPLWIPNIVVMDTIDAAETNTNFSYLSDFKHLKYLGFSCLEINYFESFPVSSNIETLYLRARSIKLTSNFELLEMKNITITCSHLEYTFKFLPKCDYISLTFDGKVIKKVENQWYYKNNIWIKIFEEDVFDYLEFESE